MKASERYIYLLSVLWAAMWMIIFTPFAILLAGCCQIWDEWREWMDLQKAMYRDKFPKTPTAREKGAADER